MNFQIDIGGFIAIYLFMVTAFAGWVIIGRVPAILHTPLMSGSNFVHGIVAVGGISTLLNATTVLEQAIGFAAVLLGAGNVAGGFAVTQRMLAMFKSSGESRPRAAKPRKRARRARTAAKPVAAKSAAARTPAPKTASAPPATVPETLALQPVQRAATEPEIPKPATPKAASPKPAPPDKV
jgi:NAD(P) transhydrogenase subunit alpha